MIPLFIPKAVGFLRAVPWWLYAILAIVLITGAVWLHGRSAGAEGVQARWDAQEAVYARQRAEADYAARKTEERHRAEYRAIADRFLKEQADAQIEADRVIADLRAGTLRLRQRFTCPATAGMPGAAADSGGADEASPRGFGVEDAGVALGIARDADAIARQLNALIEAAEAGQR